MSEPQEERNEYQEMRQALAQARSTAKAAVIGLIFTLGLLAALAMPVKTTNVNLRGQLMLNVRPRGADMRGVAMRSTTLRNANLAEADLAFATLTKVDLSRANLAGASLCGARLHEVDLSHATLTGADLKGAVYDVETRWPEGFDPRALGATLGE
jgi:uncharacterized protein YjbI with pentapeptide repeats